MLKRFSTCLNVTGRLCAAALCLMFFFPSLPAKAADRAGDEFLAGYIASILERDLHWKRSSYTLKIVNGIATLTLFEDDSMRRAAADKQLRSIDGLQGISIVVKPADAGKPAAASSFMGITAEAEAFPVGDLFRPLIADPKQPQFFVSVNRFRSLGVRYTMASVGFGETFGLYRFFGNREGNGLQLSVEGALFAQFNLNTPSYDLINADYTIGIPVTYRHGNDSLRFRIYHQSSHLGDEFLQSVNPPERVNLSYEAVELIYSREWLGWRVYGGGEYLIHKEPADLKPMSAHWGLEYRDSTPLVWSGRPIVGVFWKDKNLVYLGCNAAFARDAGFANPKDLIGKDDYQMGWRDQAELYRSDDRQVIDCGVTKYLIEEPQTTPGGETITLLTSKLPLLNSRGEIIGVLGTYIDITGRKKTEDALLESGEFNRQVIESAQEGIIVYGLDLKYQSWNSFMERLTGLPAAEVLGRRPLEAFPFLREAGIMAGIDKALEGQVSEAERFQFHVPQTGRSGWASEISAPLRNTTGEIIGVIATVRDITEHVKLEDQLRHAQKMEAVGTLAGGIAHDFNNILNVIMGYGSMVHGSLEAGSRSKEQMNEVLIAADRAANLTKRLLVFSRKQVIDIKPVNVNEIIVGVQKMLGRIIRENIAFTLNIASRPLIVLADAGQIEQVLMNLTTNARDAMPEGGSLTIGTGLQELDDEYVAAYRYGKPGKYALITIADTGCGMDAETQQKIFEPFFTTKGIGEGTGLGLAITYGIIKQHNGYIKVCSEPGQGTEFKVYLPLVEETAVSDTKTENLVSARGGSETILVAEDDAALRNLTRLVLESFGYSVIIAEDGEDAITQFMENRDKIHLVILDMIMPKKSGKEAYGEIKKTSPNIKSLFISGYTMDSIKTGELTEAGLDFVHKPVRPQDLLKKVREILDR